MFRVFSVPRPESSGRLTFTALLLSALAAAGTARAGTDNALAEKLAKQHFQQGDTVDAIHDYQLDGWNYVDAKHIVIHAGPSRDFLLTLMSQCRDLSTAENIAFTTTTRQLTKFDKLIVRGPGGIKQDCPITQINALTKTPAKQ